MNLGRQRHFDALWRRREPDARRLGANERVSKAVELLPAGGRLLDVGCGAGMIATPLMEQGAEVHGVDVSAEAVRRASAAGVRATLLDLDREALPYPDAFFDAVTALASLQYVVDVGRALAECHRVLRPGGSFLAAVPNVRAAWRVWRLAVEGIPPRTSLDELGCDGGTLHYFTGRSARELLAEAGFEVLRVHALFCQPRMARALPDGGPLGTIKRDLLAAEVLLEARRPGESEPTAPPAPPRPPDGARG